MQRSSCILPGWLAGLHFAARCQAAVAAVGLLNGAGPGAWGASGGTPPIGLVWSSVVIGIAGSTNFYYFSGQGPAPKPPCTAVILRYLALSSTSMLLIQFLRSLARVLLCAFDLRLTTQSPHRYSQPRSQVQNQARPHAATPRLSGMYRQVQFPRSCNLY